MAFSGDFQGAADADRRAAETLGEALAGSGRPFLIASAAYSGSVPAVRLLLDRGADIEARDTNWNSTPIDWAAVGSGEQPAGNPHSDWTAAAAALLEAGASAEEISLSPDDPKPPSAEVAALLRRHGAPAQHDGGRQ